MARLNTKLLRKTMNLAFFIACVGIALISDIVPSDASPIASSIDPMQTFKIVDTRACSGTAWHFFLGDRPISYATPLASDSAFQIPFANPVSAQISGSNLAITNDYCQLQFSGQYISAMRLDGDGSGDYGAGWLHAGSGYRWYSTDESVLQPQQPGTWENVTSIVPGGNTTDGVYRLNVTLGGIIDSVLDVWLNGSEITMDYSFKTLSAFTAQRNGWLWIFNETIAGWSPDIVDMVWSYENGLGRHCMTMHQMKRRPFHYIWTSGSTEYWYQGTDITRSAIELDVPDSDAAHLFINESGYLGISTWPYDRQVGNGNWNLPIATIIDREYTITVHPGRSWYENGPDDYPRFSIDTNTTIGQVNMDYGKALTRFFWERVYTYGAGMDGTWVDWSSTEYAWNTPRFLAETMDNIENHIPISPVGHVSSWNWLDGWPFPDNDSDMNNANIYDTRHSTTNSYFISAIWRVWQWTGNDTWLSVVKPRLQKVTSFFLDMLLGSDDVENQSRVAGIASAPGAIPIPRAAEGLLLCDWEGHHGASGAIGNNYWDIQPFGWLDSYVNAIAYSALLALADFEQAWGNSSGMTWYLQKAAKLKQAYSDMFWDDIFGRFIGCIDAWGERHDYGYTFINQQAAYCGLEFNNPLVNDTQVHRMYDWMENEPTGSGIKDTFTRWIYAARANTDINNRNILNRTVEKDWWVAQGQYGDAGYRTANPWPWCGGNGQLQNGGCSVYTSYHDLMARVAFLRADNAEQRLREILDRWSLPDHICGGIPLYLGEIPQQEGSGSVGTDYPFPESGMVPTILIYGFFGAAPRWEPANASAGVPAGHVLVLDPALPSTWNGFSAKNLQFAGMVISISVNTTAIRVEFPTSLSDPSLQIGVNGTRVLVSSVIDANGVAIVPFQARAAEKARRLDAVTDEHASRLISGQTIDTAGNQALPPVPALASASFLDDIDAWWNETIHLMRQDELNHIAAEIDTLEQEINPRRPWSSPGATMYDAIVRQLIEADASFDRGDLRWMLANYRQAKIIADRLKRNAGFDTLVEVMFPLYLGIISIVGVATVAVRKRQRRTAAAIP